MTRPSDLSCPCERDVLDLVAIGQWPSRADETLRAHVAACETCAEVASIAAAVRDWANETEAVEPVKVPDASVVWYRAQVRAREDAARRASRPLLVAQLFAVATVALAVFWMGPSLSWSPSLPDVSGWWAAVPDLPGLPSVPEVSTESLARFSWLGWAALAALGAWAIVGSIAYLLTAGE
jgi:hypothetical protein